MLNLEISESVQQLGATGKGAEGFTQLVMHEIKSDYENYLGTLLLPKDAQRAAFALRAFNVELAQVQDMVSDKRIGLMRMQFWKDAVAKIVQGSPPEAPVATELAGACSYYKLSRRWLERIVAARAAQLDNDYFKSMAVMEEYAEHVNSSLYYLLLECLGIKNVQADHAASHLGKAQGIVTTIRATPFHAAKRRVYLPMDILANHRVSHEDIIRGSTNQRVKDAVFDVASVAHQHLEKARSLKGSLPPKSNLVFLNATFCLVFDIAGDLNEKKYWSLCACMCDVKTSSKFCCVTSYVSM
ncbi:NADP dehydrogenase (ubiquinone) complex i, assembly factor 6 [Plakobranchus ocellatus]|uniref:15-cis-phytoene synthase n=1 Tax=Plakobranchus ocellatus TaxID=259542 RepID=A0AAV4AGW8_9GAST|nr:NADP dehydrogenase (ubiquinone) complex i, assembly factor 6 [Plakobranchus ocellatus]